MFKKNGILSGISPLKYKLVLKVSSVLLPEGALMS